MKNIQLMYDYDEFGEVVCVFLGHKKIFEGPTSTVKLKDILESFVSEGIIDSLSIEIK